jgi:hypothetical protein
MKNKYGRSGSASGSELSPCSQRPRALVFSSPELAISQSGQSLFPGYKSVHLFDRGSRTYSTIISEIKYLSVVFIHIIFGIFIIPLLGI